MEITLEKIELVKDRTGVSYKEAKEALEKTDGNVVDAIILIEELEAGGEEYSTRSTPEKSEIIQKIKDIIKKGNVTKIQLKRDGKVILNIPVTAGAIGTAVFPIPAIVGSVAALAAKCTIEIVKDDGEVIDLNEKSGGRINKYRDMAEDAFNTVSEKAADTFEDIRIRAEDAVENAKYKAAERREKKAQEGEGLKFGNPDDCEYADDCNTCDMDCDYRDGMKEAAEEAKEAAAEAAEEAKEAAEEFVDELKEAGETLKDAAEDLKE
ncbi:MAG: DUF4342 domain-containing protein [Firmicutes bacterium]|nr:DUF4342 domain-containing protein [Bacillota bacterium]